MSIKIQPLNRIEGIADRLMIPIMYLLSGTLKEKPQETHRWNNTKLNYDEVLYLEQDKMIKCDGVPSTKRWWKRLPIFHMPILGGWKKYIVLQCEDDGIARDWYIGWICPEVVGVSRIPLRSPVRLLLGPDEVSFFAVTKDGLQLRLEKVDVGTIGDGNRLAKYPLR